MISKRVYSMKAPIEEISQFVNRSVLCWLATSSPDNVPNVSPKEVFACYGEHYLIIANIASPGSAKNIQDNSQVCVSFIDILVQKGFQIKCKAEIVTDSDPEFEKMERLLLQITLGKFPFSSIFKISIESAMPIIAPRYVMYPGTTEEEQIESAKESYGVR